MKASTNLLAHAVSFLLGPPIPMPLIAPPVARAWAPERGSAHGRGIMRASGALLPAEHCQDHPNATMALAADPVFHSETR